MFSWICPRCGRENRPSDTECPNCRELDAQAQAAQPPFEEQQTAEIPLGEAWRQHPQPVPVVQQPVAQQPVVQQPAVQQRAPQPAPPPPPQRPPEPPPVYSQPPYAPLPPYQPNQYQAEAPRGYAPPEQQRYAPPAPPRDPMRAPLQHPESRRYMEPPPVTRRSLPLWLMVPLFAFAFLGLGAAVFYGYQRFQKGGSAGFTGGETPANPKPKAASSLQKYIEVVGIRLTQDAKKRPEARFVVVNHANSEFNDLTASVTLWASTSRSEEDSVGTFTFKLASIGPNEAKEITTPLKTKLKIYEMPDWQNATAEVQITSP